MKKESLEKLVNDNTKDDNDDDDDWFAAASKKQEHNQKRLQAKKELERIKSREEKLHHAREPTKKTRFQTFAQ